MNISFDFQNIQSVEFFVCLEDADGERFWQVPVDDDVQEALRQMLAATVLKLEAVDEIPGFEPGEKYDAIEASSAELSYAYMEKVRQIYETEHFDTNPKALLETNPLEFYFASFHDGNDRKLLAVKRASQFKGIIRARNRLVSVVDDTLKLVDQDVFRLDQDFDYLISDTHALILRAAGFAFTAAISDAIAAHSIELLNELTDSVECVNFAAMEEYVSTHPRAGRLVAGLHARKDLADISAKLLKRECRANQIKYAVSEGKIIPERGSQMPFLELLDRRRYTVELIEDEEEFYVAASRRGGKAPPAA